MTKETRITIEVQDIKAIEIECEGCNARQVRPVSSWQPNLVSCSVCNSPLMMPNSDDSRLLTNLAAVLAALTGSAGATRPYKIRLEVQGLEAD